MYRACTAPVHAPPPARFIAQVAIAAPPPRERRVLPCSTLLPGPQRPKRRCYSVRGTCHALEHRWSTAGAALQTVALQRPFQRSTGTSGAQTSPQPHLSISPRASAKRQPTPTRCDASPVARVQGSCFWAFFFLPLLRSFKYRLSPSPGLCLSPLRNT